MINEEIVDLELRPVNRADALHYFTQHYIGKPPVATQIYIGIFFKDVLHGVVTYGYPTSPSATGAIAKKDGQPILKSGEVFELTRLFIEDITGVDNLESSVISKANKIVHDHFPNVKAVVTYADPSAGHFGTIYQATGATYQGKGQDRFTLRDKETGKVYTRPKQLKARFGTSNLKKIFDAGHPVEIKPVSGKMRYVYILRGKKQIDPNLTSKQPYLKKGQMEFPMNYKDMSKEKHIKEDMGDRMMTGQSFTPAGSVNPGVGTYASPDVSQHPINFYPVGQNKIDAYNSSRMDGPDEKDINAIKDKVTPDEILMGMDYELKAMFYKNKSHAKKKVIDNLKKNPKYYSKLGMLNIEDEPINESTELNSTKSENEIYDNRQKIVGEIFKEISEFQTKLKLKNVDARVVDAYKETVEKMEKRRNYGKGS